jgi:hypothetical protein
VVDGVVPPTGINRLRDRVEVRDGTAEIGGAGDLMV